MQRVSWKRLAASYLCLVGLPLAAVPYLLHKGKSLQAPPSFGGSWTMDASVPARLECIASPAIRSRPIVLEIVQSGRDIEVSFDGMRGTGRLDSAGLVAEMPLVCDLGQHDRIVLRATIVPRATGEMTGNGDVLTGSISRSNCGTCSAISFRSVRANVRRWDR
jgi:hypothetical protein